MSSVQVMNDTDNVGTATAMIPSDETVSIQGRDVGVVEEIPFGHKIALQSLSAGDPIVKYGLQIGSAVEDIHPGEHVHIHNIESNYGRGDQ